MIIEFFALLKDVMIILLIFVGMVLLLFGLRQIASRGIERDCDDTYNDAFRSEIRSSKRVLGTHNLFRRFFDVGERPSRTSSFTKICSRNKRRADATR